MKKTKWQMYKQTRFISCGWLLFLFAIISVRSLVTNLWRSYDEVMTNLWRFYYHLIFFENRASVLSASYGRSVGDRKYFFVFYFVRAKRGLDGCVFGISSQCIGQLLLRMNLYVELNRSAIISSFYNPLLYRERNSWKCSFDTIRTLIQCPLYSQTFKILSLYINVKKLKEFKTVFNGDTAYITQLKQQKSKRCYYFGSTSP